MAGHNTLRPSLARVLQSSSSHNAALLNGTPSRIACFSTTAPQHRRKTKDSNKKRGVSSLYRSGPREPLSMSGIPLPRPRDFKPTVKVDKDHGLWGFFPAAGKLLWTPEETEKHGRGWTVEELRKKSWEDLHSLWWVCCRERNLIATSRAELDRSAIGFGDREFELRDEQVLKTMQGIKHALTERYYTWEDAVDVASSDPEINMEPGEGQAYTPATYEEGYDDAEGWKEPEQNASASSPENILPESQAPVEERQPTR